MSYSFQSFASGQIFTAAQANQIEESIASHRHGLSSLGVSGLSWVISSVADSFTVTQRDQGKNFAVYGDVTIGFNPVAVLGPTFGVSFMNAGTGRVALTAAAGEFIGASSQFALTPGSNISVNGGADRLSLFGAVSGDFLLYEDRFVGSKSVTQTVPFPWMCDFTAFRWEIGHMLVNSQAAYPVPAILLQWSVNSGSSFIETGYELCQWVDAGLVDPTVYSNVESGAYFTGPISIASVTSAPLLISGVGEFYRANVGSSFMIIHHQRSEIRSNGSGTGTAILNTEDTTIFGSSSPGNVQANSVNAFKILGSNNAYTELRNITIWGVR